MASRLRYLALLALIAGICLSCSKTKDTPIQPTPETPPPPDLLTVTHTGEDWLEFNWHAVADNEDGFYIYWLVNAAWQRIDTTFPASSSESINHIVLGLLPGHEYHFRVTAFNEIGESNPSNEVDAWTSGTIPPEAPVGIHAEVLNPNTVRIGWTPVGTSDGFNVSRRDSASQWMDISVAAAWDTTYTDSLAAALTTYYYRVGARRGNQIAWSVDSAVVHTPDGPPLPPDSVMVEAYVGTGLQIFWQDRSENEVGFHISRGKNGQAFQIIDSVSANTTVYFDSLGDSTGTYTYRVRSYNAVGNSLWAIGSPYHYGLCSDGVIPLCVDNWWQYTVFDSTGSDYMFRRYVRQLDLIGGFDYYLITTVLQPPTAPEDTLYYLRNFDDGCRALSFPLPQSPSPELLFRYPAAVNPNQYSYVDGDCVIVAGVNQTATISGQTYSGLYVYQRFYADTHSVQIYVEPLTHGVVREMEYVHDTPVARRDLTNFYVQNN